MPFSPTAFQDAPSTATPITAAELDKMGTQYAQALADLRNGVDPSLDTLAEIATALNALAPLASPALTGNPTAPTPATNDNDTSIATTAYVRARIASEAVTKGLVDAKGDLLAGTANDTVARVAVGSNGQVLTADSASAAGVKWATPAAGGGGVLAPAGFRMPLMRGSGTTSLQAGWVNSVMIAIEAQVTFAELVINVTAAAASASAVHLGLFSCTAPGGGTGTLVHNFGSVDTTTTGAKVLTGTWVVPAGAYYLSFLSVGNAATFTAGGTLDGLARMLVLPGEVEAGRRYLSNNGATSLPASITSLAANGASAASMVPQVIVKLA